MGHSCLLTTNPVFVECESYFVLKLGEINNPILGLTLLSMLYSNS